MGDASQDILIVSGLEDACTAVIERLKTNGTTRTAVGITGPVGSGKSTLAALVADALGGFVLSTDRYLPDYALVAEALRDEPTHSDLERLADDLKQLRSHGKATVPVWSFHEHRRTGEEHVRVLGPVLCEGIMALQTQLLPQLDVAVYVDASSQTRWRRWEQIETEGQRGWGVEAARSHFDSVAEPTFARYADMYRSSAHILVLNDHNSAD